MISREEFPITLVFPPQGHFTQPHLAVPCLKAWLAAQGFADVQQLDLSIEAYDHFLSKGSLRAAATTVEERMPLASFESKRELGFRELEAFRAAAESAVSAASLIERVEEAKSVLRGPRFYDVEAYTPAVRTLYHGLRLLSAAHFPSQLTPHNFTMGYSNDRSREVLLATRDEGQNPFLAFFRSQVLPRLLERRPRLLGMSVVYGSQLIPALTLGRLVKAALPDCHVTAGGGFLAYIGDKLMSAAGLPECLDSIVFHEGEGPLATLAGALRDGAGLESVGSLSWFDHSVKGAPAVRNAPGHPIQLDSAPAPDFDGLPLDKYFSPELVVPYDINRGCYYGECTFCTLPTVIGPGYRTRCAATIVDQVIGLRERYGATSFNFITDCMPPGMIKDLPDELIAREADINWWSDARIEPRAYTQEGAKRLYQSGCRKLLFGFETATPRLLKMMKKGQSLKSVVEVARNCAQADISVTFYAMVGFPSETTQEAQSTLDFILDHADIVREVSLQTFHIDEVAETYRRPADFGIEILDDDQADLALYHDYRSQAGMTQEESAEMFQRMMDGFRRALPIFSGDSILYFMQKSHYFLHLVRGETPDEFVARCREREGAKSRLARRQLDPAIRPAATLSSANLPFSYKESIDKLASPLARAARPDFLTGRFVADAEREAERRLGRLEPKQRVLIYDAQQAEFAELSPDGMRVLRAMSSAGSLGALIEQTGARTGESAREKLYDFARELVRLGMLVASAREHASGCEPKLSCGDRPD